MLFQWVITAHEYRFLDKSLMSSRYMCGKAARETVDEPLSKKKAKVSWSHSTGFTEFQCNLLSYVAIL